MTTASGAVPGTPPRVDCTIDADGRTVFTLRAPATAASGGSPRLLLRLRPAKGQPEETTLAVDLTSLDEGRPRGVLESRTVLEEGRWDVFLVPDPSAPRVRLRPGLRDQRALVDGYTREWPSPVAVRVPAAERTVSSPLMTSEPGPRSATGPGGRVTVTLPPVTTEPGVTTA